jgi:hypothetical protein
VEVTYEQDELDRARAHVIELLGGIAAGDFEVTHHPHAALCADCPARERLCSHETAAKMRPDPDPPIVPSGPEEPAPQQGGSAEPQLSLLEGP